MLSDAFLRQPSAARPRNRPKLHEFAMVTLECSAYASDSNAAMPKTLPDRGPTLGTDDRMTPE